MDKIYIICNKEKELDRYNNLEKIIYNSNIDRSYYEYYAKCWSNDITTHDNHYVYDGYAFVNLNPAEISLFINHISVLKKIRQEHTSGLFVVLESDAYTFPGMNFNKEYLDKLVVDSNKLDSWDFINIGAKCQQIFQHDGYPKSTPIQLDTFRFYNEKRMVCIEGLVWNYQSIGTFLELFEEYYKENDSVVKDPIDVVIDELCKSNKLNIYWSSPPLVVQVSGSIYKSHLR